MQQKFKHKNTTSHSDNANKTFFGKTRDGVSSFNNSLKVSETEKYANDCAWFKDYADYILPAHEATINGYDDIKTAYEVYNNNISAYKEELKNFCDPLGTDVGQIVEEIRPYPVIHNNVNVLKGELLKRNDTFKVILLSAEAIRDSNTKFVEALKASVEEEVALHIERQQKEMQGMSQTQIEEYINNLRTQLSPEDINHKDFKSDYEIFYNKVLKYAYYDQQIKFKQQETITDLFVSDRFYLYSGWRFGKPYIEVRNTLRTGFEKSPESPFVQDSEYVWYKKPITKTQAYDNYSKYLSEQDMHDLDMYHNAGSSRIDSRHDVLGGVAVPVFDTLSEEIFRAKYNNDGYNDKSTGSYQEESDVEVSLEDDLIWETHIEFKAYRKVIFLTYLDEYNEEVTVMVSDDFKIPNSAKKEKFTNKFMEPSTKYVWIDGDTEFTAEELWVPRKYEVIRLGDDIYPICREVPFQTLNTDRPYSGFELSTKGIIATSRNSASVSLVQRSIPSYFQYLFIKHIQNRELAKYQGAIQDIDVDQIPDELGEDIDGNPIRDKVATYLMYLKSTNKSFYSGSQGSLGAGLPSTRSPGSSGYMLGTAVELMNLQQLLELVSRELDLSMGISPQRKAAFSQDSNVRDNQQAITQSHHITEPYFYLHSIVWSRALEDYLRNFRTYCQMMFERSPNKKEHYIQYFLPDGTEELLKVTRKELDMIDVALHVTNSGNDQVYIDTMMQLSHSFGQNAGEGMETVSELLKAMTSGLSPEEVHRKIQVATEKQQNRMQQMEQMKVQSQEKIAKIAKETREDEQAHELEKLDREYKWKQQIELQKEAIRAAGNSQEADMDQDGIPDLFEIYKHGVDAELKKEELNIKREDQQIKREELASKEKIEKEKIKAAKQKPTNNSQSK